MADLPTWVTLSLRVASRDELVREAAKLGVRAEPTRDGVQLPGGFLARFDAAPLEAGRLDKSLLEGPLALGPAALHVSGGTNELERQSHTQPPEMRAMAKEMAVRVAAATGLPDTGRVESAASRKMTSLTRLVRDLAPLATAIVLPKANHLALDAAAFAARAESFLDGRSYSFPLWCYLKVRDDDGAHTVVTTGMWTFGLPDAGMALAPGDDRARVVQMLGELQREMVAEGWWPEDGASFATSAGVLRVSRAYGVLWATLDGSTETAAMQAARARFERAAGLASILGDPTLHHRPARGGQLAVEHFLLGARASMAITNGLSSRAQLGSTADEENDFVELAVTSTRLGPWANGWLDWASGCLLGHDGSRPIRADDRLVLPEPTSGIAGVIAWPFGHLAPPRAGAPTVRLWDLIPFLPDELAAFRASPGAQRAWMDERLARGDFDAMHARWDAAAAR